MTIQAIQRRLVSLGYPLGKTGPAKDGVDGEFGRLSQSATLAALETGKPAPAAKPTKAATGEPAWVKEGRRKLGLHESNPALKAFLKSDGATLGDPEKLPWCGDFVQTCIALALPGEPQPANPYLARNWLKFGVQCPEPVVGAVAVFWRGSKSGTSGHVGFVVGADATHLGILGGNQSNSISVSRIARDRLLGCRWPKTAGPIAVAAMPKATGVITTNEA